MPVNLGRPWHPEHPTNQKVDILPGTTSPSTCKVFDKIFTLLMSCLAKLAREEHLQNAGLLLATNIQQSCIYTKIKCAWSINIPSTATYWFEDISNGMIQCQVKRTQNYTIQTHCTPQVQVLSPCLFLGQQILPFAVDLAVANEHGFSWVQNSSSTVASSRAKSTHVYACLHECTNNTRDAIHQNSWTLPTNI